ncbi:MAG: hypothetical protein J6S54_01085 [Lentisphaeria bacterium]|nr:hypothetical protein [Lentisphaeria bacterium]
MYKRQIKILFLVLALLLIPMHQAKAIDPVTIAILAPVALQLANAARPYVIRGLINLGKGVIRVGKDMLELVFLPYGILKMTFGAPFGGFRSGLVYTIRGGIAIGKVVFHVLILPLVIFGVNFNAGA